MARSELVKILAALFNLDPERAAELIEQAMEDDDGS